MKPLPSIASHCCTLKVIQDPFFEEKRTQICTLNFHEAATESDNERFNRAHKTN